MRNYIICLLSIMMLFLFSGCGSDGTGYIGFEGETLYATQYDNIIAKEANDKELPLSLVKAVVQVESAGNKDALSPQGAMGLMQLMPGTADMLGVENAFDPEENIEGGTAYLRMMVDEFQDYELALAAYNAGPNRVKQYEGIPPYEETEYYVDRVMYLYRNSSY